VPRATPTVSPSALDWETIAIEAVDHLRRYLQFDTTAPPGDELPALRWLQDVLAHDGIAAELLDLDVLPGRGNLAARIRGEGDRPGVALVHHADVVTADPARWTVPPFSGDVRDGFIYGRGALDMKGLGIVHLMTLLAIRRSGVPLRRDLAFVVNAAEERGGRGADVFTERHAARLAGIAYVLTEGGFPSVVDGQVQYWSVTASEKVPFWLRLSVTGTPGHGARPGPDNAVVRLARALVRLGSWDTPLRTSATTRRFFRDIAPAYESPVREWLADVDHALADPAARAWLLADPRLNAMLRDTITPTVLHGSRKTNVIPAEASAEVDIRLLPDTDPDAFLRDLRAIIDDPSVHVERIGPRKAALDAPLDTPLFRAITHVLGTRDPGVPVTTPLPTGATDRPAYGALGLIPYGFMPFRVENRDVQRGIHGDDERLPIRALTEAIHVHYEVLRALDAIDDG
jgi:acetylornithine deacetylase/succinyl-diaminopimelate desuccinylase-like protein